ncbi:MAG: hypothetical protein HYR90_00120 [Candidatus Andersenbacteria bacterium]|nr:hypothetical protein [Candidatus Andersenbacteria bacterium]MBI3251134.1 hypothetical protein [Candidatus Andersenbacteria bacterium]
MNYFYGPDTFGAREEIGRIGQKNSLAIHWLDRQQFEEKSLTEWLDNATSGLFGGELPVVRDSCEMPKAFQEQIIAAVKSKRTAHWIVWDRQKPDKRTEYFKFLKKYAQEFPALSEMELSAWLGKIGKIDKAGARELVMRVGTDRFSLQNELARLNLTHEPTTFANVQAEVPRRDMPEEIFGALDALSSGNTAQALTLIEKQLAAGESELYVLSMLAYQFKTLLAIKTNQTKGLHPFVVEKNQPAVRRFSVGGLQEALTKIMATDFAIKQGKIDARTGLMMLIMGLVPQTQKNRVL